MRVKRYRAATLAAALAQVKAEMGPEALILKTRVVAGDGPVAWLRALMGQARLLEVTAARAEGQGPQPPLAPQWEPLRDPLAHALMPSNRGAALYAQVAGSPMTGLAPATMELAVEPAPPPAAPPVLLAEVQQVKEMVGLLLRQGHPGEGAMAVSAAEPASTAGLALPGPVAALYHALLEQEVEPTLARSLCDTVAGYLPEGEPGATQEEVHHHAGMVLERLIGKGRPIHVTRGQRRTVALVGPTGVGKTTTIAKLAARFALAEGRKVALITVDTFRIGAVDQLRTYAQISGLPCHVAITPADLARILNQDARDADLVLIDTAGRSHRDEPRMHQLKEFWAAVRPDEIHLALAAGTRLRDALDVVERYREAGFDRLLFTKLDETGCCGLPLNVAAMTQKPLSYFTSGQHVPEDLSPAGAAELARRLW